MKNKKNLLHILKIVLVIVIIFLIGLFSFSYRISKNNDYKNRIINNIKKNYSINQDIFYANAYGQYYIFKTSDKVYVLDNNYKEVYKEEISKLANNKNNYDLIYKEKKLLYENTIHGKNNITYEYYDIHNYKQIKTIKLEK